MIDIYTYQNYSSGFFMLSIHRPCTLISMTFQRLLHNHFWSFHDHLSAQIWHLRHFVEKVRKLRLSKLVINLFLSAKT